MATTPKDLMEFSRLRRKLIAKHGRVLLDGNPEETQKLMADVEPLAKFARVPAHRIVTSMLRDWLAQGNTTPGRIRETPTGRKPAGDPPLQNLPMRTEEGRRVREAFRPKRGK